MGHALLFHAFVRNLWGDAYGRTSEFAVSQRWVHRQNQRYRTASLESILAQSALDFIVKLHQKFEGTRQKLLHSRELRQKEIQVGQLPGFSSRHTNDSKFNLEGRKNPARPGAASRRNYRCLSAVTGNQAIQQVKAGLKAIYVSDWQVAADMNNSLRMYPDQSLYPSDSVPCLLKRINNSLMRADQIHHLKGDHHIQWMAPLVADAEAGFGGPLHAFEVMKMMIEEGAAGVHFEDQLASVKKCGHLGGKVLVPTREFITKLVAARLAADVCHVDTLLIARTDAHSATLLTSDIDPYDKPFIYGSRTHEGFYQVKTGLDHAISRALAYAPYADLLWFETSKPSLEEARRFANAVHRIYPRKLLAYNCSPSFNWKKNLTPKTIASFQKQLGKMGTNSSL